MNRAQLWICTIPVYFVCLGCSKPTRPDSEQPIARP